MSKEIEIQRIVEDESLNLHPLVRLFLLLLCLSIVGLLIAPFAYLPLRHARIKSVTERMKGTVRRDFRAFIGGPATYLDCHPVGRKGGVNAMTGTGIAYNGKALYMLDDGVAAMIPWETVRTWRWYIAGYQTTKVHGGRSGDRIVNSLDNIEARGAAFHKSGFFVQVAAIDRPAWRSEEHTSELQSLMRISDAVFCVKI